MIFFHQIKFKNHFLIILNQYYMALSYETFNKFFLNIYGLILDKYYKLSESLFSSLNHFISQKNSVLDDFLKINFSLNLTLNFHQTNFYFHWIFFFISSLSFWIFSLMNASIPIYSLSSSFFIKFLVILNVYHLFFLN